MELDEFKQLAKQREPDAATVHSAAELELYTRKKTNSVIGNIRRSILFELIACIVFAAVAAWAWYAYPIGYIRVFSFLSLALCCFLLMYLGALYKKITLYEKSLLPVKHSLQEIIDILSRFTKAYFQFTMLTLPIAFIFGLITGFININSGDVQQHFNWQRAIVFYCGWFVFWSVMLYFFSKWYIKKLYGNYLQQLKEQLKDIENG